jgi:hypothetical protein
MVEAAAAAGLPGRTIAAVELAAAVVADHTAVLAIGGLTRRTLAGG